MRHFLSAVLRHKPDAIVRFTGLCHRRGISIERLSFHVSHDEDNIQVMTVLRCDSHAIERLRRHILNMADVLDVTTDKVIPNQ